MAEGSGMNRRDFIRRTAGTAAGVALGAGVVSTAKADVYKSILPQSIMGANETIRTAHIGVGGMGTANLRFAMGCPELKPIAVCDLWQQFRERAAAMVEQAGHAKPSEHTYLEEIFDNKDVDAVVVSTPDHWHTLPVLMACDTGKDVYCEKPLTTTIGEGLALEAAVRESGIILQGGTMQRSGTHFQEAVRLVQEGYIGKIARVDTWINDNEGKEGIGDPPDEDPPKGLDWERYLGWTPRVPFNRNRFIYQFRWFLDYSGGKMTDWGAHLIDIATWGMGQDKWPSRVTAIGGKYMVEDNRTTPDQIDVIYEYDDYVLSFSNRVYNPYPGYGGNEHGIIFFGDLGTLRVDRGGFEVYPNKSNTIEPVKSGGSPMNEPHWANWVQCIKDRKDPICSVDVVNKTTLLCHVGTCAYVGGAQMSWDADKMRFTGADRRAVRKANQFAYRDYQNGWKLKSPYHKDLA
jgi:predicted dehydrogenase